MSVCNENKAKRSLQDATTHLCIQHIYLQLHAVRVLRHKKKMAANTLQKDPEPCKSRIFEALNRSIPFVTLRHFIGTWKPLRVRGANTPLRMLVSLRSSPFSYFFGVHLDDYHTPKVPPENTRHIMVEWCCFLPVFSNKTIGVESSANKRLFSRPAALKIYQILMPSWPKGCRVGRRHCELPTEDRLRRILCTCETAQIEAKCSAILSYSTTGLFIPYRSTGHLLSHLLK